MSEDPFIRQELDEDNDLLLIDEDIQILDDDRPEIVDLTDEALNQSEQKSHEEIDLTDQDELNDEDHLQHEQTPPQEVDLTEDDAIIQEEETSQNGENYDEHQNDDQSEQNGASNHVDDDLDIPPNICHYCKERKIFKNNKCYKCRGKTIGSTEKPRAVDYHRQVEQEFLNKCREAGSRRRISNKPLTFSEEFLNPKRGRPEPTSRQSLPARSNVQVDLNGIKQEPLDEEDEVHASGLPHFNNVQIKQEMDDDIKPEFPVTRMRVCTTCKTLKKHYAKGKCLNCYRDLRKSETALAEEAQKRRASRNSKIRSCITCNKHKPHYAKERCKQCYQSYRKNLNKYGNITVELDDEKPNTEDETHDFSNFRVCQACREFKLHHRLGMCRSCYEDKEEEQNGYTLRHERQHSVTSPNYTSSPSKKTQVGVTKCVVCNALMQEADLRSQRTIVCRRCHQEGKTRHRWCIGCGQLRVHDGANRCRPCHLAYKKGIHRGPVDLNNPRYRGKFDAQSPNGSVSVERQIPTSSAQQPKKSARPSATHCVVCEVPLQGDNVWSTSSLTCRGCREKGMAKMRWCSGCGQLKFHQGRGRCRECYKILLSGIDPTEKDDEDTPDEDLTENVDEEDEDIEESQPDILAQLNAILNPEKSVPSPATSTSNINVTIKRSRPLPVTISQPGQNIVVPQLSQEDVQQKIDELTNPVAVNCLVCRTPIDFSIQMRNAKICLTCRDKGLQRMRWCVSCHKLKFHQGRGRCQECYRAVRSSGASNNNHSGAENSNLDFSDLVAEEPIQVTTVTKTRNLDNLPTNQATTKEQRQRLFRERLQALCSQFTDLEEARRLPKLVQLAFTDISNPSPEKPDQSRIQPQIRQQQPYSQRQIPLQIPIQVNRALIEPPKQQPQKEPRRFVPPPLKIGESRWGGKCLICPNRIDFSKQLKTAKVCVECTAKNLKRHRWCLDCKKLKPCIGRGRCSFCYTVHMKENKTQQRGSSKRSSAIDISADFNESANNPEVLLQQILQASGIQLDSLTQNGQAGSGDEINGQDEPEEEVIRGQTIGEMLRNGRGGDTRQSLAQAIQLHSDANYVTLSDED